MKLSLSASQKRYLLIRRCLEFTVVLFMLPISMVITLTVAVCISLESQGSPFFLQQRPGRFGKLFTLYKLRTMTTAQTPNGFQLTQQNDHRVTHVGKIVRTLHLDEFPQLMNVLRGEMSFIGPRPLPAQLYDQYKKEIPNYDLRHMVRPGISGFAQVWQGYTNTVEEETLKLKCDIYYISRISLKEDLKIVWQTFTIYKRKPGGHRKRMLDKAVDWYNTQFD